MCNEKLISIIVPVYKAESFIDNCVKSVIDQGYTNWELLLIDDGSPDNCPALCDEWAAKDSRIKAFHKKNGGPSSARNVGLQKMKGQFVTFLDSDDCLKSDCLEKCVFEIKRDKLDVVQFYFLEIFPDGKVFHHNRVETDVCSVEGYIASGLLQGCSCGGMYNADIIREHNIRYNEKLHYLEDAFFVCDIVKYSKRLRRIVGEYYEYHKNPNGSDRPRDWDYYLDSLEYAASYKIDNPEYGTLIDGWCTMLAMRYVTLAPKRSYSRFSKAWRNLHINKEYLSNAGRRDVVLFDKLQRLIGVRFASYITKTLIKVFYGVQGSK